MRHSLFLFSLISLAMSFSWAQENSLAGAFDNSIHGSSKWGFSYFNFVTVGVDETQAGAASANIYNYVGANYKLSRDERINIRPAFSLTTAGFDQYGENKPADARLNDAYINYANYSMALLPGDWEFSGQYRVYLPTSESAQQKKTIAQFHSWMISEKLLGNGWAVQYNMKPTLWVQSQKAYRYEYDKTYPDGGVQHRVEARANQWGKYDHYMKIGKYLNRIFTPSLEMGFIHEWFYTSNQVTGGSASRNQLKIAPNTEIHVNRDLWFILGVENTIDLNDTRSASTFDLSDSRFASTWEDSRGQSINLFRPENTQYYLMTFWSL